MTRIEIACAALLVAGCGGPPSSGDPASSADPGSSACDKAKECCSKVNWCDTTTKNGWTDRCAKDTNDYLDTLHAYHKSECDKLASAQADYLACVGGVSCDEINSDAYKGHIARCDDKAKAFCQAEKDSGDACGSDFSHRSCDGYQASFNVLP